MRVARPRNLPIPRSRNSRTSRGVWNVQNIRSYHTRNPGKMTTSITLYDLATKPPNKCFSPNCWKTRAALNFKNLPYSTVWLEYPDVKPTLSSLGLAPNESSVQYTCPAIQLPDGSYLMDSAKIAPALESLQPTPSLHLDGPHERVHAALGRMFGALMPALLHKVRDGLNPVSAAYYEEKFRPMFGMGLDELAQSEMGRNAWTNAEAGMAEVSGILKERPEGPYVLGETASYADIVLASGWQAVKLLDVDWLRRLYGYDAAFERHFDACQEWFVRES